MSGLEDTARDCIEMIRANIRDEAWFVETEACVPLDRLLRYAVERLVDDYEVVVLLGDEGAAL